MKVKKKKGVSPVVATVLLIAIVVVLALIIFLWARSFISERLMKKGESAESICSKIVISSTYFSASDEVQIKNNGNVPIYDVYVKATSGGSTTTTPGRTNGIPGGIPIGRQGTVSISPGAEKVSVVPVILGEDDSKNARQFTCPNEFEAEIA